MIDVNKKEYYSEYLYPGSKDRTFKRLKEINDCGMTETGYGSFGCKGVMSGLYIEKVWDYSDESWNSYMNWARKLIKDNI